MKTLLLVTASLMLASAAQAEPMPGRGESSPCWKWNEDGYHLLVCSRREGLVNTPAEIVARTGMVGNNTGPTYQSTITTITRDGHGNVTGTGSTTSTTTLPRYYGR